MSAVVRLNRRLPSFGPAARKLIDSSFRRRASSSATPELLAAAGAGFDSLPPIRLTRSRYAVAARSTTVPRNDCHFHLHFASWVSAYSASNTRKTSLEEQGIQSQARLVLAPRTQRDGAAHNPKEGQDEGEGDAPADSRPGQRWEDDDSEAYERGEHRGDRADAGVRDPNMGFQAERVGRRGPDDNPLLLAELLRADRRPCLGGGLRRPPAFGGLPRGAAQAASAGAACRRLPSCLR